MKRFDLTIVLMLAFVALAVWAQCVDTYTWRLVLSLLACADFIVCAYFAITITKKHDNER